MSRFSFCLSSRGICRGDAADPRRVIASEAKQSISRQKERMDCFVATLLAMTWVGHDTTSRARGAMRPKFCKKTLPSKDRGRREDRVRAAPAVSYAIVATRFAHEHTGLAEASGLPCAMALRLIRDRPGDPAFCDTIALGQRWLPSNLTPASGRQTQTISPYVTDALVFRTVASTASLRTFVTIASAPLIAGDGRS